MTALVLLGAIVVNLTVASASLRANLQAFFIHSRSMEPTLQVRDRVLVDRLSDVHRGDVIVHERDSGAGTIRQFIQRVVAVGGDTVESRGEVLWVNDRPVDEAYVATSTIGSPVPRQTIPANHVFLMGDNRANSADSRVFGPVDEDRIVGRAFVKIWPLGSLRLL